MQRNSGQLIFSASDLVAFLECEHLTTLDLTNLETSLVKAEDDDPAILIQTKGMSHEAAYPDKLKQQGLDIVDISQAGGNLEQRIGRMDRICQPKTVQAINFVFEDSLEFRLREVLEQKLSVIFNEFVINKTGDVLDSAQAGKMFEDVFASAILNPSGIETSVIKRWPGVAMESGRCVSPRLSRAFPKNRMCRRLRVCTPIRCPTVWSG